MVYARFNELVHGVYKPTYNWGASSYTLWWKMSIYRWLMGIYLLGSMIFHRHFKLPGDKQGDFKQEQLQANWAIE